jgi:hypothetical protein
MKSKVKELLNEANEGRIKLYYNLAELETLTGMCSRALKYRMLDVKKKYKDVPMLLSKKYRQWYIHYTLVDEFKPKYKTKNRTVATYDLKTLATWNPKYNYDVKYHLQLIKEIKESLPAKLITYTVETDNRGYNHTHLVSDADVYEVHCAIEKTLNKYLLNKGEIQFKIEPITNKYSTVEYIKKAPLAYGEL